MFDEDRKVTQFMYSKTEDEICVRGQERKPVIAVYLLLYII